LLGGVAALACLGPAGCATVPMAAGWESRLRGDSVALLGEVHDNAAQHRLRRSALERAFDAGWRPALALEMFDRERQADIERARRERPGDAQHLIAAAGGAGWDWPLYRPLVALALRHGVPLIAADLSNADTTRIVRDGFDAVFDADAMRRLGLDRPIDADWQASQEREIDRGHCRALPPTVWPRMARAQFARDAVLAQALEAHAAQGAVLIAGNGHVRRDLGVPRWLRIDPARVLSVGYLEDDDDATPVDAFDVVLRTAAAPREDPCEAFRKR
jgi:uncharacterized iron-regulated protein